MIGYYADFSYRARVVEIDYTHLTAKSACGCKFRRCIVNDFEYTPKSIALHQFFTTEDAARQYLVNLLKEKIRQQEMSTQSYKNELQKVLK